MRTTGQFWTNYGSSTQQNSNCMATNLQSCKPSKKGEQDMLGTAGDVKMDLYAMFSYGHMHGHTSIGWPVKTFISFVQTLDAV